VALVSMLLPLSGSSVARWYGPYALFFPWCCHTGEQEWSHLHGWRREWKLHPGDL